MADDPKQKELIRKISESFQAAQTRMAELRQAVQRNSDLSQIQSTSAFIMRERDRALRNLGEAVWKEVEAGRLALPESLAESLDAVRRVDAKVEGHRKEIADILDEGAQTAERLQGKNRGSQSSLAPGAKKR